PLTGLPGNHRIEDELADRVVRAEPFAVLYLDLDNFKSFNDCYGFLRGDEVIMLLATAARRAALEVGEPSPFIGHIGGDDFVVVCLPEQAEPIAKRVVEVFDNAAPRLHDPVDAERGYLEVTDRQGSVRRFPVVSVSIGIALTGARMFTDKREVVDVATEMKKVAKTQVGSSIAIDRRTGDGR
ncbi:MAG TPA: GGDEF domain-containing protein, partial [Frankiaceae bacterium]|nr:GGDEF domain-containing protein [Frankiaceae bacterium]